MGETDNTGTSVNSSFIDLGLSGLRRSSRLQTKISTYFSLVDSTPLTPSAMLLTCRQHLLNIIHLDNICAPIHYTAFFTAAPNTCEELNLLFDGTINKVFEFALALAADQQQNETYTFKDALLQVDSGDFIKL